MSWNQDLRCTFQKANPSPIHLFKILLPKFIHRVVFHYITQIIISDFKDFRMKYLEDKSPILLLFMQFNPSFKSRSINKDCSRSAPNPKNSSLLWRSLLPLSLFAEASWRQKPIQRYEWDKWVLSSVEILGYIKNGVCLEDEFGVPMNSYVVNLFIQQVRDGNWDESITILYCILV